MAGDYFTTISYDPGGTTGWAVTQVFTQALYSNDYKITENLTHVAFGEFYGDEDRQIDDMLELVDAWEEDADLVVEQFILRMMSSDPALLSPVRISAAFKWGLRHIWRERVTAGLGAGSSRKVIWQQPSLAMSVVTDDRLKAIGLHNPTAGQPHARDALRHNLTWLRRKKELLMKQEREKGK